MSGPEGEVCLATLRHDAAHVLAQAVQDLFPDVKLATGPATEDGFYYDFERSEPFCPGELAEIEARMHDIVDKALPIVREEWSRQQAIDFFAQKGERYKVELVQSIAPGEVISVYRQGGEWLDLCCGPHQASTKDLGHAFKLTGVSAVHWRGDSKKVSLQRIYGTAWRTNEELESHLGFLREARERDHRVLGKRLDLFHFQSEAPGCAFWHPRGYAIWQALEQYMRRRMLSSGYEEVKTPQLLSSHFWEQSGHWSKFRANMFAVPDSTLRDDGSVEPDAPLLALKPMNCPAHVQIFKQRVRSHRDLPLRLAEFGCCHRNEASGALQGLMRVRQMTQDDAHIFCALEQVRGEVIGFSDLLRSVYTDLGFDNVSVKFSTRPDARVGSDALWDRAERVLECALEGMGLEYQTVPGEGAFYGPKLEFHLRDAIGRFWQCGTLQLDFVLPERLGAFFVASSGQRERPVMLHRAILGTFERFIAILIEHYSAKMPMWLAPVQATVATITSEANPYAEHVARRLTQVGMRVLADTGNQKIHYKVRQSIESRVPAFLAVGKRDMQSNQVSLRLLGSQQQRILSLDDAVVDLEKMSVPPDLRR